MSLSQLTHNPHVAMATRHLGEHYPVYLGLILAFWAYVVYKYVLRVRFFSSMRNYPGPEHGHWFFGQLKSITAEAPGYAQLRWHRKVSACRPSPRLRCARTDRSDLCLSVRQRGPFLRPAARQRDPLLYLVLCTQDYHGRPRLRV